MKTDILARIFILIGIIFFQFQCTSPSKKAENQRPPNILIMLADDMGYADLNCYGGLSSTPNLDRLASQGIRFADFYAAAPNCSPSRTGLMTGRAPSRVGMYNYRDSDNPMHLRDEEITIAELLKKANYQTAHMGKWHLGELPATPELNHPQPHDQGFDYSLGTENNAEPSHLNPVNFVRNGKKLPPREGYSCQLLADEAIAWLDTAYNDSQPFFLYVAFHEPHQKVASPPELVQKYPYQGFKAEYLANVENLDSAAGRILNHLVQKGLNQNTLMIFSSDNGSYRQESNQPLRARKAFVYDGGIRVPGIFSWPGKIDPGQVETEPAGLVDLFPTIAQITQKEMPQDRSYDGTSIAPLLKGQDFDREKPLFWFFYRTSPELAIRLGDQMLLGIDHDTIPRTHRFSAADLDYIRQLQLDEFEVYNLRDDMSQQQDLSRDLADSIEYQQLLRTKMDDIQQNGYQWQDLLPPEGTQRPKMDWIR